MTKQIVIKLNEKKFKPLLESLICDGHRTSRSYSECVEKILFFAHLHFTRKDKRLEGLTERDFINKMKKISSAEGILRFLEKFDKFIKNGEVPK